jgi:hypothetical protein
MMNRQTDRRRVTDVIGQDEALRRLFAHAQNLLTLQRRLRAALLEPLAGHLTVANVQQGTLVLNAESPSWATRARFASREILDALNRDGVYEPLTDIRIHVQPETPDATDPVPRAASRASVPAITGLARAAKAIADPALSGALSRLAQTLKTQSITR